MSSALVLFRNDLRLADNPALTAACAAHTQILALFIHDRRAAEPWELGAASRWWLHHSLLALNKQLQREQGRLHIAAGTAIDVLRDLLRKTNAEAVYWNRRYEPANIAHDVALKEALQREGTRVSSHRGNLWCEPWQLRTDQGSPYRTFTPFWNKLQAQAPLPPPLPKARVQQWIQLEGGLSIDALRLLPVVAWDDGLARMWQPGEQGAARMMEAFATKGIIDYARLRDHPYVHGTSRLSPHLRFGELTPSQIVHCLQPLASPAQRDHARLAPYLRQLAWREFSYHMLYHFPRTPQENFNRRFDEFPWAEPDTDALRRWQQGCTGVPLVDAGMRELWHTGWMHNRVRMVTASFLTKNLRQHWQHGARWFWDTLVDADLANNTMGWQWVAGSGVDAAPYFRIFNPYTQARKFDPDAAYLKRWLPELSDLPSKVLHEPWRDPSALAARGYPLPMVDVASSRKRALAAYDASRG